MLSNPLQRFSSDHSLPTKTFLPDSYVSADYLHRVNLDASSHGSQHAVQHLQQHVGVSAPHSSEAPQPKHRELYKAPEARLTSTGVPIRRRISRACDQCNQMRTKCDGQHPCAHCIEFGLGCEYIRERKKRGKISRKDLAQKATVQAAEVQDVRESSTLDDDGLSTEHRTNRGKSKQRQLSTSNENVFNNLSEEVMERGQAVSCLDSLAELSSDQPHLATNISALESDQLGSPTSLNLDVFGQMMTGPARNSYGPSQPGLSNCTDISFGLLPQSAGNYITGASPISAYPITGEPTSAGRVTMPSSPPRYQSYIPQINYHQQLRYPVLNPLLPHLGNIIPVSLACDLIDLYFASYSSAHAHPMSPYILGFVFRKRDSSPVTSSVMDDVAVGGLGIAIPCFMSLDNAAGRSGPFGTAGTPDDIVTYIHLATVFSASEYKGASLRWWNAAWSLARELKLGCELPSSASQQIDPKTINNNAVNELNDELGAITNEGREERRRIWWLAYTMDRHLALCYNRPLFLLDIECGGLLQPMNDTKWQNGDFKPNNTDPALSHHQVRGPHFECSGHSIFGYFLPLMAILGEIVELHHARNHPRFGISFRSAPEWDGQVAEIRRHLEIYEESLKKFEQQYFHIYNNNSSEPLLTLEMPGELERMGSPSARSVGTNSSRMTESDIQTRIVITYGTHVMHVLHILLAGKWDPINLFDDDDLWISSQDFITATGHAVSAAEAISNILQYDPGLEFMPFFYGIYLLQGSFLLLLIADKLQAEASASVVRACETIIRAHEACVVTLNTGYQRNFSRVMRSALAQVRGRVPEDLGEQHQRRRELLALYRWTGDGTGLAL
ncbi:hypothetical protein TruAng_009376 [Truncatella angustata]|nr:hypothetical protein TruAng_009376 [Truncatella angustata]